ncbi:hypothetical protein [Pontibacter harenae]|uniref:hypothetical protein n=1 Tax=Pontibacter harenae TaxID=2894083 RepID=UPI001E32F3BD|nr:hypothetical protein [Pontibacter harenae]MCC9168804.1 hypothetical protein [Pontibacter harenae]
MILFENSILRLDYSPSSDILEVGYPDLHDYLLVEIKHSIDILVDTVKHYDVKRVLLDSSRTSIEVNREESRMIAVYLATGMATTRVQKVARLQSPSAFVEHTAEANIDYITQTQSLPYQLQNFTTKEMAIGWLKA